MESGVILNFILALGIGAIIGLEREIIHQKNKIKDFAGIRGFILISILSFIIAYISINVLNSLIAYFLGFALFVLLIIASYVVVAIKTKRYEATTGIAAIIAFLLCSIVALDITRSLRLVAIVIAVVVASLLAIKERLHEFAKHVKMKEVYAAIKMAVISLVILPFLPNKSYSLLEVPYLKDLILMLPKIVPIIEKLDIFNPFKIWLIVVFISGLGFIGYILVKTIGANKGIGVTSFLGGMVSSTAVTVALSEKSKGKKIFSPFVMGIILASAVMFIRVLIEVIVVNPSLIKFIIFPLGAMALSSFLMIFLISRISEKSNEKIEFKSPFSILPALGFGLFFVFILFLSKLLFLFLGSSGIYLASIIAGLADVDAIVLTLSSLANSTLPARTAVLGITLAVSTNTLVKAGIAYFTGNKKVGKYVFLSFLVILGIGLVVALLM